MPKYHGISLRKGTRRESTPDEDLHEEQLRAATLNALKRKPKRIVFIGSTKSGKSSLIRRFLEDTYTEEYATTLEECYNYQYTQKRIVWNLDIVDLCGPYMFPVMRDLNVKRANVLILVYEIGNPESTEELVQVIDVINELRPRGLTMVLVGTKLDNQSMRERVKCPDVLREKLGEEVRHVATSSKLNIGVSEVFDGCLEDYSIRRPSSVPPTIDEVGVCECSRCNLL